MPLPLTWIASCGADTIKLWDLEKNFWNVGSDGCHLATVSYTPASGRKVLCARWNHTNYVIASAGEDPRITMWTAQGQRLGAIPEGGLEKMEERVNTLCFGRRSRLMVTAGSNHSVKVWDMKRRICIQTLSGHASTVTCVAINAKDEQLASVSEKGTLCLHNLNSGTRVAQLRDPDGQALGVVEYSPHAKHLLATAGDGGAVHLWNATSRRIERSWTKMHTAPVTGLCFSPTDPKVLVTVGLDKRLLIIDPTSNSPPIKVSAEVPLSCVHFNDDGITVAAGTADGRILFYDVRARVWKTDSALQAFKKSVQVTCIQWQSFLHREPEDSDSEPPARPALVNFQPEVDLKSVPPNLRGSDKVMASLGSALFTPQNKHRDSHNPPGSVNGGPHTPVRMGEGIPSEMDVFSPLVEVQPITPFVPKHWDALAGDRDGTNQAGLGANQGGLGASRLSFTELGTRSRQNSPGRRPSFPEPGSRSGQDSPGGPMSGAEVGNRSPGSRPTPHDLGKPPQERFSSVSDLRLEAKRKLQESIKAGGGVKPPGGSNRGEESRATPSWAFQQRPTSSGSSRSGPFERDPSSEALHNPSAYLPRNPSFDQLPSASALPPRYSHLPPSLDSTPADRARPGTFTSSMYASARLLAEPPNPPASQTPKPESLSFGSPVSTSENPKPLPQHDVTPSIFGSPVASYDSAARPRTSFVSDIGPHVSERDDFSPDWLSSKPAIPQISEQGRLDSAHPARSASPGSSALESSSNQQGFSPAPRVRSLDPPPMSEARGADFHQGQSEKASPRSREAYEEAERGTGIGRRQEFGHGKDVRWHKNASVRVDMDSRPPSEPTSVAPTPHSQPFSLQLVQRALEDSLGPLQRSFHQEIQNLHLELLRQFHMQQGETQALVASILERQVSLEDEVRALRKENQQLKHFF